MEKKRIITAAICIPVFLVLAILGGWFWGGLLLVLTAIGLWEYCRMFSGMRVGNQLVWLVGGCAYIVVGFLALFLLRHSGGVAWLLWLFLLIWSTDTAAYELGRRFGRRKLAPSVSPNKTIEGAAAGVVVAMILGLVYALIFIHISWLGALVISILVSCIGQIGDLLESFVKRMAGVKDSGALLPGHGGVLDRFDSMLLGGMFMYIFLLICR